MKKTKFYWNTWLSTFLSAQWIFSELNYSHDQKKFSSWFTQWWVLMWTKDCILFYIVNFFFFLSFLLLLYFSCLCFFSFFNLFSTANFLTYNIFYFFFFQPTLFVFEFFFFMIYLFSTLLLKIYTLIFLLFISLLSRIYIFIFIFFEILVYFSFGLKVNDKKTHQSVTRMNILYTRQVFLLLPVKIQPRMSLPINEQVSYTFSPHHKKIIHKTKNYYSIILHHTENIFIILSFSIIFFVFLWLLSPLVYLPKHKVQTSNYIQWN